MINNYLYQVKGITASWNECIDKPQTISIVSPFTDNTVVIIACDFTILMSHITLSFEQMCNFYKLNDDGDSCKSIVIDDMVFISYGDNRWSIRSKDAASLLPICKSDELFKVIAFALR